MADEDVIKVEGLVTRFGRQVIHDGVNLAVKRGEIIGIVGGSGTGKSVLMREIIGLMEPAEGRIEILGQDRRKIRRADLMRLRTRMGVLFQDGALFSAMTVQENVSLPLREHTTLPADQIAQLARIKIAMAGLPPEAGDKIPSELSGGMRKRAGLARALATDPDLLFLDEPTAGLDPIGAAAFDQLILTLRESLGLTVVMITHDLDSLLTICDRIAVLVDRGILVDTTDAIMKNPHPWIQSYFGGPRGRAALEQKKA